MSPVVRWRIAFLGLTLLLLGMEGWAAWDNNDDTEPWTDLIVKYVPGEVFALVFAGLFGWLIVHFGLRYWRKQRATSEKPPQTGPPT